MTHHGIYKEKDERSFGSGNFASLFAQSVCAQEKGAGLPQLGRMSLPS